MARAADPHDPASKRHPVRLTRAAGEFFALELKRVLRAAFAPFGESRLGTVRRFFYPEPVIGFLRFVGVANAAIWFGASIFFTFSVGPAVFSNDMKAILGPEAFPGYSGRIALVFVGRYFVWQEICGAIALTHLVAEWLYMGKPLQRLTLWLLLGIFALALVGGYSLQPKLQGLHRATYGPGATSQQQEKARQTFKLWHATAQALNLVMIAGVTIYLWRVTTPGSGYRYRV